MSDISSLIGPTAGFGSIPKNEDKPSGNSLGKDAFLKLLVAQLRFQNPLKPTDPSEFMTQTAQFTMVEKLEEIAKQSTDMLAAQNTALSSAFLGQKVKWADSNGIDRTGVVTGVRLTKDGPQLKIGNTEVALSAVKEVSRAG